MLAEAMSVEDRLARINNPLADEIYQLLKFHSLCSSQIGRALSGYAMSDISSVLEQMRIAGLVIQLPDRKSRYLYREVEYPWHIIN